MAETATSSPNAHVKRSSHQPLALCAGAAMLGILGDRFLPLAPAAWFVLAVSGLLASRLLRKRDFAATFCVLLVVGAFFGLRHDWHVNRFESNDPGFFATAEPQPCRIEGRVLEMPRLYTFESAEPERGLEPLRQTRFLLHADRLYEDGAGENRVDGDSVNGNGVDTGNSNAGIAVDGRLEVHVSGDRTDLHLGDRVRLYGMLSKPEGSRNPGDYDRREALRRRRVLAVLELPRDYSVQRLAGARHGTGTTFSRLIEGARRFALRTIRKNMDVETAPLASALLLGLREDIDDETNRRLRETGTIHILAISGLHIGLVAALVGGLLRFFEVSRRLTAVALVIATVGYLLMTDMRPPAVRATVLVLTSCVGLYFNRQVVSLNSLALTVLVVLAVNPTELFQFGAQLSFLGAGVFLWLPRRRSRKTEPTAKKGKTSDGNRLDGNRPDESSEETGIVEDSKNEATAGRKSAKNNPREAEHPAMFFARKIGGGLGRLFLASLAIWLVLLPLLMSQIHLFTPVAILVNPLLWLPLTASLLGTFVVVGAGLFDTLTGLNVAPFFGMLADTAFHGLLGLIAFFHRLPYGHCWVPGPAGWWNLGFYLPLVSWTLLPNLRPRLRTLLVFAAVWIAVGWTAGTVRDHIVAKERRLTITTCSVGHGLAVLIVAPDGRASVYDVGSLAAPRRSANVLSRQLWRAGKTRIDHLFLSHPDSDHYNGAEELLDRFAVGEVVVPPEMFDKRSESLDRLRLELLRRGIPVRRACRSDRFDAGFSARVLHPDCDRVYDVDDNSNAVSLVLLVEHLGIRILLTGDLDGDSLTAEETGDLDVLFLPHHGGRSSMTEPLLAGTSPEHLLISGGGFWRQTDLIAQLRDEGFAVYSTFEDGAITLTVDRGDRKGKDRGRLRINCFLRPAAE